MTNRFHIQISQHFQSSSETELLFILERLLPIKCILGKQDGIEADGVIVSDDRANKVADRIPGLTLPSLADPANKFQETETEVEFADDPDVPFPFRGRTVSIKLAQAEPVLSVRTDEKVLATSKQGPIWLVSEIGGVKYFRSNLPLPNISSDQNFSDVFNGECFLEMLVLLQFLREIIGNAAYQNPPLRAGFIIDDPNLHWPRYGFVDYRQIAAHAQKENYHVSFATIPLDTWFTHTTTAGLFRANSRWLSLLIHGNNHVKKELAQNYSEVMRRDLLQQAIRRINYLEQKANLHVCRVMVPPHGACSDEMLAALSKCGFESACISSGSLRAHNPGKPWTKTLGFYPAEIIQGCLVLPRWGLTGNVKNTLLLAAYLGQPMILRGHHQDLKEGVEVFDEYARFINNLGEVVWSSMTDLSWLNYLWRMEGTTCHIRPLGKKISFNLPNEATEITIESPSATDDCGWQEISVNGGWRNVTLGERLPLVEDIGSKIYLERNSIPENISINTGRGSINATFIMRRLLTEARDRFLIS